MGFKSFEDLEVYKAAREFRKKIYKLIKGLPPEEKYGYIAYLKKRKNQHTQST
jgi:hypothetical protein